MAGAVIVVGSYNQDHAWSADHLPAPGATRLGSYLTGPGGKGFNQAVASVRAGAPTVFITALGEDAAAANARALAATDGIVLRAEVFPDIASGTAGIFVDNAGRNVIIVAPGANAALSEDFVAAQQDDFASAAVVLVQLEVAPAAVLRALQAGAAAGALAMLNPAPVNAPTSDELLAAADVLTPNETEFSALLARHAGRGLAAETIAGLNDSALHALCRELAPRATIVLTMGASGAFVSHGEDWRGDSTHCYRVPVAAVKPVDTTGAGDAFSGALAARLATQESVVFAEAVTYAARYAGQSTERHGAALSMPWAAELRA